MQLVPWAVKDARQLPSKRLAFSLGRQTSQHILQVPLGELASQ